MAKKLTYEELEQRVKVLEKESFEQKRVEEDLKHQRKRLESLIEYSSLAIVTLDERHNIIACNRDFEKLFYFNESEVIGINLDELIVDQESIEDARLYTKQTLRGKAINGSGKRQRKDGAHIDVSFIGVPVIIDGKVIGAYGIYQDISERKKMEEALRKSENTMKSIFRSAPIGIGVVIDRVFQDVNERLCEITGYSKNELIGKSARIVYPTDEDYEYVGSAKYNLIEKSGTGAVETRFRCKDGKIIHVLLSSTPLDPKDLSLGVAFTALDFTARKQVEEALRESEQELKLAQAISKIGHWSWDVASDRVEWSDQVYEIFKAPRKEPSYEFVKSFVHPEDLSFWQDTIQQAVEEKKPFILDYRAIRSDGITIWVHNKTKTVYNELEELRGYQGTVQDITERKQTEDALRESETKYRNILENIEDGYYEVDTAGNFTFFNNSMCRILGYSTDELMGKNNREYMDEENAKKIFQVFHDVYQTGIATKALDWKLIKKDGSECFVETVVSLVMDSNNKKVGFRGVARDITERKQAEEALRQSEKRFRDLSEMLPEVVFETDANMNLSFVNKHAFTLFGYSQQDFEDGLSALDMLVPEDRERAADNVAKRFSGESFGAIEYRALRKDGSSIPILLHATPIIDRGITKGMRGIIVDLSERKLIEKELQQSRKMEALGTLSGGIAHEFNNILGIIIGNTELAIDDVPEWNPAKDCLEEIRTASLRAKDVVRQIMSFSRKTPATRKPIQISTIIQESLKLMRSTIPTNIDIRQEIPCKDEMILANPTEINQILMNLCTNSVHGMEGETGWLKVRLETTVLDDRSAASYEDLKSGEYVKLTIKDCGHGIDPKIMGLIFDPYFTTKDVDKGLGMGLAVVYGIVKKHNGAIRVNSKVDKGTTVEVLFPVTKETAQIEKEVSKDLPRGTERILFVDDEASLVKMVTQMLERQGYEVVGKTSSTEALKLFEEESEKFGLVITDMAMPDMTGDRLAKELIKIRPAIPVIICTGYSDRMGEEKDMESGIAAYTMKPLLKTDLVKTVRRVLDKSKGSTR